MGAWSTPADDGVRPVWNPVDYTLIKPVDRILQKHWCNRPGGGERGDDLNTVRIRRYRENRKHRYRFRPVEEPSRTERRLGWNMRIELSPTGTSASRRRDKEGSGREHGPYRKQSKSVQRYWIGQEANRREPARPWFYAGMNRTVGSGTDDRLYDLIVSLFSGSEVTFDGEEEAARATSPTLRTALRRTECTG